MQQWAAPSCHFVIVCMLYGVCLQTLVSIPYDLKRSRHVNILALLILGNEYIYILLYTYSVPHSKNANIFTGYLFRSYGIKTSVCVHNPYNIKRSTNWKLDCSCSC